jgi:hypothetical protein
MKSTGDAMQRWYFFPSIYVLAVFLAGCAASANAQAQEVKEIQNSTPTESFEQPTVIASATAEVVSHDPPAGCPVTTPQDPPFTAPEPYSASAPWQGYFWYGSRSLWTVIPQKGSWYSLPKNPEGYTQKVFWWREGYSWTEEPEPALSVSGERLDAPAPPLNASKATNAYASDIGSAMLVGVDFPTYGCWKITGKYKDAELSFVIWVAP